MNKLVLKPLSRFLALFIALTLACPHSTFALRQTGLEESPERKKVAKALLGGQPEPARHQGLVAMRGIFPGGQISPPARAATGLEEGERPVESGIDRPIPAAGAEEKGWRIEPNPARRFPLGLEKGAQGRIDSLIIRAAKPGTDDAITLFTLAIELRAAMGGSLSAQMNRSALSQMKLVLLEEVGGLAGYRREDSSAKSFVRERELGELLDYIQYAHIVPIEAVAADAEEGRVAREQVRGFLAGLGREAREGITPVFFSPTVREMYPVVNALSGLEEQNIFLLGGARELSGLLSDLIIQRDVRGIVYAGLEGEIEAARPITQLAGVELQGVSPGQGRDFLGLMVAALAKATGLEEAAIQAREGFQEFQAGLEQLAAIGV